MIEVSAWPESSIYLTRGPTPASRRAGGAARALYGISSCSRVAVKELRRP